MAAALTNDYRASEMYHMEADQHETAIIDAARELVQASTSIGPRPVLTLPRRRYLP